MSKLKSINSLQIIRALGEEEATGRKSHDTELVTKIPDEGEIIKDKHGAVWYLKRPDPKLSKERQFDIAIREVVAQEFFRMLMPSYPKTRLVVDPKTGEFLVISKGVSVEHRLEKMDKTEFRLGLREGKYKGLGETCVICLFVNEGDFKEGNIIIDDQDNVIKIDGDRCFAKLRHADEGVGVGNSYDITPRVLAQLPYPTDYMALNWLDVRYGYADTLGSSYITADLKTNEFFVREKYRGLLKILSLPDDTIKEFVASYVDDDELRFSITQEMLQRKGQLGIAAMADLGFREYLKSDAAQEDLLQFADQLNEFYLYDNVQLKINHNDLKQELNEIITFIKKEEKLKEDDPFEIARREAMDLEPDSQVILDRLRIADELEAEADELEAELDETQTVIETKITEQRVTEPRVLPVETPVVPTVALRTMEEESKLAYQEMRAALANISKKPLGVPQRTEKKETNTETNSKTLTPKQLDQVNKAYEDYKSGWFSLRKLFTSQETSQIQKMLRGTVNQSKKGVYQTDDAARYDAALTYIKENRERAYAKELMKVMQITEAELSPPRPGV